MTMIPITTPLEKGQSMGRPYLFTSENYPYWKRRIDMFIQAHDTNVRTVILEGPYVPIKTVDHRLVLKPRKDWDDKDRKLIQLNGKVVNILYYVLRPKAFNRVIMCENAKEIWDILETLHEGTT